MGILMDFADNVTYGASDLNSLRCALATKGVLPEESTACKVIAGEQENTVKICGGQALFSDGARCEIDQEGVTLHITDSCYVYLKRQENTVEAMSSGALPSGGDTVLLAQVTVSTQGLEITDMREYTALKIPSCMVNSYEEFYLKKKFNDAAVKSYDPSASLSYGIWCKVHELDVSNYHYRYIMLFDDSADLSNKRFLAWGNLDTGKYWTSHKTSGESELEYGIDEIVLYQQDFYTKRIRFVKNGSKIELWYLSKSQSLPYDFYGHIIVA